MKGVNFKKEIPLNEISEKLKILLKKSEGGQFYKRNPFKRIFWKYQNFAQIFGKKFKKADLRGEFETPYF